MTLDEAIKHAEEVAVENLEKTKGRNAGDPIAINCFECAEEHRQLADWLKELKQLRDQSRWVPVEKALPDDYGKDWVLAQIQEPDTGYLWIPCASEYRKSKDDWYSDACGLGWLKDHKGEFKVIAWMPLPALYEPQESEKINCKATKCENCQNHNYCDYEPQKSEVNEC